MPVNVSTLGTPTIRSLIEGGLSYDDQWATVQVNPADTASQTIVAAPAAGSRLLVTHLYWYTASGATVTHWQILDGAGGTALFQARSVATTAILQPYLPNVNILFGDAKAFVIKNVTGGGTGMDTQLSFRAVTILS